MKVSASVVALARAGSGLPADNCVGRQMPIKELRERTSSLVGRDVVIVGMVETVVAITEKNFDDWRLMSPCVGSYYLTLKDETDVLDVLVKGRCVYENKREYRASDCKRGEGVDEGGDLCPNLNPFERNPFIRAVAKDFGELPAE